jgi:hypothetical protein
VKGGVHFCLVFQKEHGTGSAIFRLALPPIIVLVIYVAYLYLCHLKRFILSLFNVALCSLLFDHCLMLRVVLFILSLFNVALYSIELNSGFLCVVAKHR